jgi:3-hydroxyisobutyrate dehydrogenase-like beta-hydroxyacid dehydrogenase
MNSNAQAVRVIGLGIMGYAMAANPAKAGFKVHGYDVVRAGRTGSDRPAESPSARFRTSLRKRRR